MRGRGEGPVSLLGAIRCPGTLQSNGSCPHVHVQPGNGLADAPRDGLEGQLHVVDIEGPLQAAVAVRLR